MFLLNVTPLEKREVKSARKAEIVTSIMNVNAGRRRDGLLTLTCVLEELRRGSVHGVASLFPSFFTMKIPVGVSAFNVQDSIVNAPLLVNFSEFADTGNFCRFSFFFYPGNSFRGNCGRADDR